LFAATVDKISPSAEFVAKSSSVVTTIVPSHVFRARAFPLSPSSRI